MTDTPEERPDFVWAPPPTPAAPPPDVRPPASGQAPILLSRPTPPPARPAAGIPRRTVLVGVLLLVVVALVAALVVALVSRGTTLPGNVAPAVPAPPAFPDYAPADCDLVDAGVPDDYTIGHDRLPSIIAPSGLRLVSTCRRYTATSVQASYAIDPAQWDWFIANFALQLEQYGLTPGPPSDRSGYLWGRSVDAGQWLLVSYAADATTGLTVQFTKGPRSIVPDGLVEASSDGPDVVGWRVGAGGGLVLRPVRGWTRYRTMWSYQGTGWQSNALVYNNVSGNVLAATMAVWGEMYDDGTSRLPLIDAANGWMTGMMWDRFRSAVPVTPDSTTVYGYPALTYSFTMYDTAMRYVFIAAPTTMYIVAAQVDAANPGLQDEVEWMIDSSIIG